MRKISAVLAVLGLTAVGLVGCSASGSADCTRPVSGDPAVLSHATVTGDPDSAPTIDLYTPFRATETAFEDIETGTGTPITSDAQLIAIDLTLIDGSTGKSIAATNYDGDLSQVNSVGRWTQIIPGFADALQCASAGSRIAIALAPGDVESETAASLSMDEDTSAFAVVDVRKVYLGKADGANQYNASLGLPTVVRAPDGRPGVIIPDADAPTDLVVQTIKKGDGAEVTGEQPVRVHYTGLTWADRTVFQTTWDGDPASLTLDAVVPGLADALEGATVGSQLLVVIPPDQGYGDAAQGAIPADSTLVFVVDILGLDQAAPAATP